MVKLASWGDLFFLPPSKKSRMRMVKGLNLDKGENTWWSKTLFSLKSPVSEEHCEQQHCPVCETKSQLSERGTSVTAYQPNFPQNSLQHLHTARCCLMPPHNQKHYCFWNKAPFCEIKHLRYVTLDNGGSVFLSEIETFSIFKSPIFRPNLLFCVLGWNVAFKMFCCLKPWYTKNLVADRHLEWF